MTDAPTNQPNLTGSSLPVTNLDPPPEGTMAAKVSFFLSTVQPGSNVSLQLSSQGGLQMSQVVTLAIDNSANVFAISVTHGAFLETITVAAGASVIVPTFSSRGGAYALLVNSINISAFDAINGQGQVDIICMNYARAPGSFGSGAIVTPYSGAQQNTMDMSCGLGVTNAFTGDGIHIVSLIDGAWIMDSLDLSFESITPTGAGAFGFNWILCNGGGLAGPICRGQVRGFAASGSTISGAQFTNPISRTWPYGFTVGETLENIVFNITNSSNYNQCNWRVNLSGLNITAG